MYWLIRKCIIVFQKRHTMTVQQMKDFVSNDLKDLKSQQKSLALRKWWELTWWRHQMETFSALLFLCAGNSPVTGEFPSQRPVMCSFDVFFDLHLNKRFSKQWWGWWFGTPSHPLWRHCNEWKTLLLKNHQILALFQPYCTYMYWEVGLHWFRKCFEISMWSRCAVKMTKSYRCAFGAHNFV